MMTELLSNSWQGTPTQNFETLEDVSFDKQACLNFASPTDFPCYSGLLTASMLLFSPTDSNGGKAQSEPCQSTAPFSMPSPSESFPFPQKKEEQQPQRRAGNCFMIYCKYMRPVVQTMYPKHDNIKVTKILSLMWKKLSQEEKAKWKAFSDASRFLFCNTNQVMKPHKKTTRSKASAHSIQMKSPPSVKETCSLTASCGNVSVVTEPQSSPMETVVVPEPLPNDLQPQSSPVETVAALETLPNDLPLQLSPPSNPSLTPNLFPLRSLLQNANTSLNHYSQQLYTASRAPPFAFH